MSRSRARPLWALAGLATLLATACSDDAVEPAPEPVAAVFLTPPQATLDAGTTVQFNVRIEGRNGTTLQREVRWRVGDPTVATVDDAGLVTAVAAGMTSVVASSEGVTGSAPITVLVPVASITLAPAGANLLPGQTLALSAVPKDAGGQPLSRSLTFTSSDPTVATVDARGVVAAVAPGSATITASIGAVTATADMVVLPPVNAVVISPAIADVTLGTSLPLGVTVIGPDGKQVQSPVTWTTSDPNIATVDAAGVVTPVGLGRVTITATAQGHTGSATIMVVSPVSAVIITPSSLSLQVGDATNLTAKCLDEDGDAMEGTVTWYSSAPSVVTVTPLGQLTAVSRGTAVITASMAGATGSVTVTVQLAVVQVVMAPTATVDVGTSVVLTATAKASDGSSVNRPLTWSSNHPGVATVNQQGLVTGVSIGTAVITASTGQHSASTTVTVSDPVGSVTLSSPGGTLVIGQTMGLSASVKDAGGNPLNRPVTWATSDPTVATIDANGVLTGVGAGTVTVTATAGGKSDTGQFVVVSSAGSVIIGGHSGNQPVHVDSTMQLTATVYDGTGNVVPGAPVTWASSDPTLATVDNTGLVTGVAPGTVTITATAAGATGTLSLRVAGESETTAGNNLSVPAVFAEGIGMTGLPVSQDAGLRPTSTEGITVTGWPFFYSGNTPDFGSYYLQGGANVWQAEWEDGATSGVQMANVAWGDNLTHHTWNTHAPIRIEVKLTAYTHALMKGYAMTVLSGSGPDEVQGTDGSVVDVLPSIYTVAARLTIEKLDDNGVQVIYPVYSGSIAEAAGVEGPGQLSAEVNKGGAIIYGFSFKVQDYTMPVQKFGWYRISFSLDPSATIGGLTVPLNTALGQVTATADSPTEPLLYTPQIDPVANVSWVDVWIDSAKGGH